MAVGGELGGLLQPFDQQSPMNLMAMIAQLGQQNPEALAELLAARGAQPPLTAAAPSPTVGALAAGQPGLFGGAGTDTLAPSPLPAPNIDLGGLVLPGPTAPTGALGGVEDTGFVPPGADLTVPDPNAAGVGEGILKAIGQLKAPAPPRVPTPPRAIAPGRGGPAPDPKLLAAIFQLLQGGQAPNIPSLGQLIAGKGGGGAAPQLTL